MIADRAKIERILERIAYQIAETNCHKKKLIFVGIQESGWILAQEVIRFLQPILVIETQMIALEMDKKNPESSTIVLSENIEVNEATIILVDDVINSGKTLFYALKPFFELHIDELQTLILVERKYKRFPIVADFVGISLNTTLLERIEVRVSNGKLDRIELV